MNTQRQLPKISAKYVGEPLDLYERVRRGRAANTLLLESADITTHAGTQSLILADASLRVCCRGRRVSVEALDANGAAAFAPLRAALADVPAEAESPTTLVFTFPPIDAEQDEGTRLRARSPLDALRALREAFAPSDDAERFLLGGIFGYDLVEVFEKLPAVAESANTCPDFLFYLAETAIKINHVERTTEIFSLALSDDAEALEKIRARTAELAAACDAFVPADAVPAPAPQPTETLPVALGKSDKTYCAEVEYLKAFIRKGDIFQVVPSRSFSAPCPNPEAAYRALKKNNPSPYMFYVDDREFAVFGASPEISVKFTAATRLVELYPIAGTRRRGFNADGTINCDLDSRVEFGLRMDTKELSEHLMLVDLARNDLARIAKPNTRRTSELLKVDRYSHVMHLVSHVVAELRDDLDALHAYLACMNMGTLTGAPKIRATELLREVERERRGSYGGAVGWLGGNGDMDTCILIRSAFVKNGVATVQAGGGVVLDSVPQNEADESRNKAMAPLVAVAQAQGKVLTFNA
ncbi:MAG: anthranilate synthase component 1 [Candidatus Spyradosoma sp.]